MVNFPIWLLDRGSHSPALLDLFLSSETCIWSTMPFPLLGYSDHVAISVSINFPSNLKWDDPFHYEMYNYSCADWDAFHDHLRDVLWEDAQCFCCCLLIAWAQVGIDVYIPHRKYQVKLHSSPWFSATCAAAIVHANHFFRLHQHNKSSES